MHRPYSLLSSGVLALGLLVAVPAPAARPNALASSAVKVDTRGARMAEMGCSVSARLRLLRAAGTTSIITTTFALLGALYILRRRRF